MKRFIALGIICSVFVGMDAYSASPRGRVSRPGGASNVSQSQGVGTKTSPVSNQVKTSGGTTNARAAVTGTSRGKTTTGGVKSNNVAILSPLKVSWWDMPTTLSSLPII